MAPKDGLELLLAMPPQAAKRAGLVAPHQPRVAHNICRKNGRQSPYNPLAGQKPPPKAHRSCGS
jgi:hypothetical protein